MNFMQIYQTFAELTTQKVLYFNFMVIKPNSFMELLSFISYLHIP